MVECNGKRCYHRMATWPLLFELRRNPGSLRKKIRLLCSMCKRLSVLGNTERVSLSFCVNCFQDVGLQGFALFGKERADIDNQVEK